MDNRFLPNHQVFIKGVRSKTLQVIIPALKVRAI